MSVLQTETIVKFGTGDIEVATIRPENGCLDYGIAFRQKEVSEIGSPNPTSIAENQPMRLAVFCALNLPVPSPLLL